MWRNKITKLHVFHVHVMIMTLIHGMMLAVCFVSIFFLVTLPGIWCISIFVAVRAVLYPCVVIKLFLGFGPLIHKPLIEEGSLGVLLY